MTASPRCPPTSAPVCPPASTAWECILFHARRQPDAPCVTLATPEGFDTLSRGVLWQQIERWAAIFSAELPHPSAILFSKRLDVHLLAAYVGAMVAGHVPAQIAYPSAKLSASEFRRKLDHIRRITPMGGLFTDADLVAKLGDLDGVKLFTPASTSPGATLLRRDRDDALIQYSSGSTGLQKGVYLSQTGLVAHMQSYARHVGLRGDDRIVSWLPLYHDMGLIAAYLMPLMCGVPFVQMDPFQWVMNPARLFEAIEAFGGTICYQPNFALHHLARRAGRSPTKPDLSGMRAWVNCSEPARSDSHALFRRTFPSVREDSQAVCYALAENTFAVSQTLPHDGTAGRTEAGALSCGTPLPGVEVTILPADGAPPGQGEVSIRSPFLFDRFTDGTRPHDGGFYRTGDIGFIGAAGDVFITGRKKDIIIVQGKNVFPQDVEFAASETPGVYPGRTVAFGRSNDLAGSEELVVLVERATPTSEPMAIKKAVFRTVEAEVGIAPHRVEVVDHMTLVKTSSGKISRSRNRELYAAGELETL